MGGGEERAQVAGLWYVARRPLTPGPWPLLLFLHGAGERGPEDGTELELVQKYGPWQSQGVGCFFLLAPQCPSGVCWPGITDQLSALVRSICVRNDIDRSRCFATGISMGGFGVWALASKDPSLFKAIAPVCGGFTRPTTRDTGLASILQAARVPPKAEEIRELRKKQLRVWLFHGDADKIVSVLGSQGPFAELGGRARGEDHLRLTIYKDVGHNCWGKAYKTSELLEWLIQPAGQPVACPAPPRARPPPAAAGQPAPPPAAGRAAPAAATVSGAPRELRPARRPGPPAPGRPAAGLGPLPAAGGPGGARPRSADPESSEDSEDSEEASDGSGGDAGLPEAVRERARAALLEVRLRHPARRRWEASARRRPPPGEAGAAGPPAKQGRADRGRSAAAWSA